MLYELEGKKHFLHTRCACGTQKKIISHAYVSQNILPNLSYRTICPLEVIRKPSCEKFRSTSRKRPHFDEKLIQIGKEEVTWCTCVFITRQAWGGNKTLGLKNKERLIMLLEMKQRRRKCLFCCLFPAIALSDEGEVSSDKKSTNQFSSASEI